eukprot:1432890-Ditylum_brightwellii.AAC.1
MEGEGTLSKLKIFLSWLMDSHLFLVKLSRYKGEAWSNKIKNLLRGSLPFSSGEVESIIGKLNHTAGSIIPSS